MQVHVGSSPILCTKITESHLGGSVIFCVKKWGGTWTPSAKPNTIGLSRSEWWAEPIKSHSLHQNDEITFCGFVIFIYLLFTKTLKIQHLIQQVFNVSQNRSFFTDLLDFVEKNNYYQTTPIAVNGFFWVFNNSDIIFFT